MLEGHAAAKQSLDDQLGDAAALALRDHARGGQRAWEAIPWLWSLADAIDAGLAQRKPILLWAMNGCPLGAT